MILILRISSGFADEIILNHRGINGMRFLISVRVEKNAVITLDTGIINPILAVEAEPAALFIYPTEVESDGLIQLTLKSTATGG